MVISENKQKQAQKYDEKKKVICRDFNLYPSLLER